ncbi:hypothetical protein GCM10019016_075830 [Streptomyces prasinosporus]|uniref:Uncharacterized protein n=1 Tax=Streptomyces prasinosporus TaxID=68256 RepID=A0ABP6TZ81_9ACTN
MGTAAAAEDGGEFGDVGAAGAHVHAQPARYGLVHVPLHQELGDGVLDLGDAVGGGSVRRAGAHRDRAVPQVLEDLDEVADEAGVAQFEGDLVVVARGDERDGLVADDQTLHQLVDRPVLHLPVGEPGDVGQLLRVVAGGVLVEAPDLHTTFDQRLVALEAPEKTALGDPVAGLDRQELRLALGGREVERRVDPLTALQDGDGVAGGGGLRTQRQERFEGVGELHGQAPVLGDLPLYGLEALRQRDRRRHGAQPGRIVRIRVQEGQFEEAGGGLGVRACDAPGAQRCGIEATALFTELGDRVGMCALSPMSTQISTPQGPEHAGT